MLRFKRFFWFILLNFFSLIVFISCDENSSNLFSNAVLVKNVNLIAMQNSSVHYNTSVLIEGNLITRIFKEEKLHLPKNTTIIDGTGKYLIPGLSDMHMHIDHPDILKVNLAYGITSVMNYRGLPEHLILKDKAAKNEIFSPIIYTTGDYMEGYPATVPGFLSFKDTVGIRESIQQQKKLGYDFIKVYRNLDTLMHQTICKIAKKNSMPVVGHLSPNISLEQSLKAGQKVVAHVEELMYFFNDRNEPKNLNKLIGIFMENDVTFTPNLTIFRSLFNQVRNIDSILSTEELKYLHPSILQSWRKEYNINHSRGKNWAEFMENRFTFLQNITNKMYQAGIPILASSDAPTSGAIPGLAVHKELEEFVQLGMSPYEALKTATVNPGKFIENNSISSKKFGLIKEGYRADLILLEENPMKDVKNTTKILGVIKNGIWYPKKELESQKNQLANHYVKIDSLVELIEKSIRNENIKGAYEAYTNAKKQYQDDTFLGYYTMWYAGYNFLYGNKGLTKDSIIANKAIQFYKMYRQDYPNMHGSYYLLGMAYKVKKDSINAIENFKKSLELHPYNPYAKKRLNELLE